MGHVCELAQYRGGIPLQHFVGLGHGDGIGHATEFAELFFLLLRVMVLNRMMRLTVLISSRAADLLPLLSGQLAEALCMA